MKDIKVPARLHRAGFLEASAPPDAGEDDRRVHLVFSSEVPVFRDFGFEVLGHDEGEADLSLLATGRAPLLIDHVQTIDSQVGVVESAWIEGGKGRAVVRLGKSARASEILARVRDGEITGVSVGYTLSRLSHVGNNGAEPIIRAHWRPYEITLCPVPADPSAGIGRAAGGETEISLTLERNKKGSDMTPEQIAAAALAEQTRTAPATVAATAAQDFRAERARVAEITALGRKFKVPDATVDAAVNGDVTAAAFGRSILDTLGSDQAEATRSKNGEIGLSEKETRSFSLMNAIRYLANPTDQRAIKAAGFEIEVSQAAETKLGRSAKGLLIPADILAAQNFGRAQSVGVAGKGGNLVATDYLDSSFIGLLRKKAALTRLGVRTLSGLQGNVDIPRQSGGGTAYWVGEGAGPTDSDLSFNLLGMTPHTLAGAVAMSRRSIIQASPDMEFLVRDDLIKVLALEMDRVGINGDADVDAPDGLLDSAINTKTFAVSGAPTWAEIVGMESEISSDDADVEGMKYLFNATMRGHLKSTPKVAGTAEFIMRGRDVNGYDSETSNNAPAGGALLGNWTDFIVGLWSGLDLTVDTATLAATGGVYVRAFQDMDFGIRHPESFCYGRFV